MHLGAPLRTSERLRGVRAASGICLLLLSFAGFAWLCGAKVSAGSERENEAAARQRYDDKIAKTYGDRYQPGKHFLPSNMTTESGGFIDPANFPTAQYCGHCHQESHAQWRESAHSNANRAPWYLTNVGLLKTEKGVEATRHCEGCHDPILVASGALTQGGPTKRQGFDNDGITCMVCHSIQKVDTRGTGSFVLGAPAVLVDDSGKPIHRPVSDSEILAHLDRHSAAVMKPFYKTSEYCAACHKAALPRELNDYKWQRAISLYDEWQNSSFAQQSPLPFYTKPAVSGCQSCHMLREDIKLPDPGAKQGQLASHRWLGANTLVPDYYHFAEQSKRVAAFLQNDMLKIDIFALEHGNRPAAGSLTEVSAPLGRVPFRTRPGELVTADVIITNKGIAHSLVPEQRDMYEAWVEFKLEDAHGKVLKGSGDIDPKSGALDERAQSFTNRLINTHSEVNRNHQVWNTRVVAYNNTIQSGRSQIIRYTFHMPAAEAGPIKLLAAVKYRRFNQHFIDFGMKMPAGKHYPQTIVTMATGENAPVSPAATENPTWMRWNNYGIALLDAQQFDSAISAFAMVVKLRPEYPDGFTNRAIAQIQWQKYSEARADLTESLKLAPANMRATYYRGVVERMLGDMDAAVADLRRVSAAFPRSRDAHRELGFTFYQMHLYQAAREQYEVVQTIDPDDLSAHYNLAILYRRLGMKDDAAREAAKFEDQKDDPAANTYALAYLRRNAAIANETRAWHAHNLDADFDQDQGDLPTGFTGT